MKSAQAHTRATHSPTDTAAAAHTDLAAHQNAAIPATGQIPV
jgi:hypothetical protein